MQRNFVIVRHLDPRKSQCRGGLFLRLGKCIRSYMPLVVPPVSVPLLSPTLLFNIVAKYIDITHYTSFTQKVRHCWDDKWRHRRRVFECFVWPPRFPQIFSRPEPAQIGGGGLFRAWSSLVFFGCLTPTTNPRTILFWLQTSCLPFSTLVVPKNCFEMLLAAPPKKIHAFSSEDSARRRPPA